MFKNGKCSIGKLFYAENTSHEFDLTPNKVQKQQNWQLHTFLPFEYVRLDEVTFQNVLEDSNLHFSFFIHHSHQKETFNVVWVYRIRSVIHFML